MISKINDGYIWFEIQAGYGAIFHFVHYKVQSIWDEYKQYPTAWHLTEGFLAPSDYMPDNQNLTLAYKGQHETVAKLIMVPTHYTSEKYSLKYNGFKMQFDKVKDGDTVNMRTIPHKYRPSGNENSGFAFEV